VFLPTLVVRATRVVPGAGVAGAVITTPVEVVTGAIGAVTFPLTGDAAPPRLNVVGSVGRGLVLVFDADVVPVGLVTGGNTGMGLASTPSPFGRVTPVAGGRG
jgi:hypothetical protein